MHLTASHWCGDWEGRIFIFGWKYNFFHTKKTIRVVSQLPCTLKTKDFNFPEQERTLCHKQSRGCKSADFTRIALPSPSTELCHQLATSFLASCGRLGGDWPQPGWSRMKVASRDVFLSHNPAASPATIILPFLAEYTVPGRARCATKRGHKAWEQPR